MKINGNLQLNAGDISQIENLRVEKVSALPAHTATDAGRLVFLTNGNNVTYFNNGTAWVAFATGGNAAALQTEVDAIESSLGGAVNGAGVFVPAALTGAAGTALEVAPTSITAAIMALNSFAGAHDALSELTDVLLTGLATGDYLKWNGTKWVPDAVTLVDVTDVTATAAEVNQLHLSGVLKADLEKLHAVTSTAAELNALRGIPATLTATELGYVDGVTSPIQAQLNLLQAGDTTLNGLAALAGTGIVVETGVDTFTNRTLVAPSAGITIANAAGITGNPTFALANDLAALEGLTTTGYMVRTGDGTAATRSFSTIAGDIVITGSADGVLTDTTFGLATVTQDTAGTFVKVTLDGKGRVTGNTPVTTGDITALVDTTYVNIAGDTMTGDLNMGGTHTVTGLATPVGATDAANKAYVDAQTQGLTWKNAVVAASTGPLTLATGFAAGRVVDGVTLVLGDRILVKDQAAAKENGIYIVTVDAPTRALDMNAAAEFDGSAVFVQQGTINEGTGWTETATVTDVINDSKSFSQFSGGQAFVWGTGLSNTGNTVFVNLGAGIVELPSDEIGIDIVPSKAVQLTGTATGDKLTFVLDGAGLEQSSAGLKISALGVTNAMLAKSQLILNGDTGTDALVLGDTLQIKGTGVQGISTATTESSAGTSTVTITAADASASQKGVASFAAVDFDVTVGAVTIKAAGVDNVQLANSTIGYIGTTGGTNTAALGTAFSILGGSAPITTVSAAGSITINVADATTGAKGLASFDGSHFSVTAGAVSLAATLGDLTNVNAATVDSASVGDLLQYRAGEWTTRNETTMFGATSIDALSDVTLTATATGQTLVYSAGAFVNKKTFHLGTFTAATSWVVTHDIGQQYCNVTIVDNTDEVIIPQSIKFDSATRLTVTFNAGVAGKCVVMGIA